MAKEKLLSKGKIEQAFKMFDQVFIIKYHIRMVMDILKKMKSKLF